MELLVKKGRLRISLWQRLRFYAWKAVESSIFRCSPVFMYNFRNFLLRIFGAKIGRGSSVHPSVRIQYPWNLEIGENTGISFSVDLYCLDKIVVGSFVSIGYRTNINTGSHNYNSSDFDLETAPVSIASGCFIGTDCYINPGVRIGKMCVIGARSSVFKDLDSFGVYVGSPCVKVKKREIYE